MRERGLTFIELILVIALVAVMAGAAVPLVHNRYRKLKEIELQRDLRMMREAIDRYHDYASQGMIEAWDLDWEMYPKDLQMLVDGVKVKPSADAQPVTIKFLRNVPVDPMTGESEWNCRGYDDDPDERSSDCDNLYDVFSASDRTALDGTRYAEW